ncbi:GNAT family N-acetyltransferase [Paenibacillus ferrarius]|uniref:GNAT family N-acetyltransferase n=1 Tax=Paenibacillus ferrarius TaxID=1469647 RepID=UPI003D2D1345
MLIRPKRVEEAHPVSLLLSADPSWALVEAYLARGECFVAELGGEVIGVYVLVPTGPGTAEIMNIAVAEELQGQGIGKQLVRHAVETARERGYVQLEIGTGNSSLSQLALYQKCGFRIVGVEPDFFVRHYPEAIYENGLWCRDMIRLAMALQFVSK